MILGVPLWVLWLTAAIALIVIEIFSSSAIALCIALGSIGGLVGSFCGASVTVQLILFAVAMVVSLMIVPPIMKRYNCLVHPVEGGDSNMDALIGREGVVMFSDAAPDALGRVKIDGDRWQVRAADHSLLVDGQRVRVVGHESIILIVETL